MILCIAGKLVRHSPRIWGDGATSAGYVLVFGGVFWCAFARQGRNRYWRRWIVALRDLVGREGAEGAGLATKAWDQDILRVEDKYFVFFT